MEVKIRRPSLTFFSKISWLQWLDATIPVLITILTVLMTSRRLFLLIFLPLGVTSIVLKMFMYQDEVSRAKLEEENRKLEAKVYDLKTKLAETEGALEALMEEIVYRELMLLGGNLRLRSSDRLSLYFTRDGYFEQVGRYSPNPALEAKGRMKYPMNQGCISQAWRQGWTFEENLPDPRADYEAWVQSQVALGMPRETAEKLQMKSRCYVGISYRSFDEMEILAVLVLESEDATFGRSEGQLKRILTREETRKRIVSLSEKMRTSLVPERGDAQREEV